jgi:Fe-S cluster biogenesis protein NfuA
MPSPAVVTALSELNALVAADGGELVVKESSDVSLIVQLDLSQSTCPSCVVPKDLLLDILRSRLQGADPDLRQVELEDPRESPDWVEPAH